MYPVFYCRIFKLNARIGVNKITILIKISFTANHTIYNYLHNF